MNSTIGINRAAGRRLALARTMHFQSAHHLPLTPKGHKCRNVHGHSYELTVWLHGPVGEDGFVVDNAKIDETLSIVHDTFDHQDINAIDLPGVSTNPTAENIVAWVWDLFAAVPGFDVRLKRVELREGPFSLFAMEG